MIRARPSDTWALAYLVCFVFGISVYTNAIHYAGGPRLARLVPPFVAGVDLTHNDHLGSEYYSIAGAIASGRGFADPFEIETGPTAWMPPLYCYLLALLIVLLGSKTLVVVAVILLKNLTLVATGFVLYSSGRSEASPVPPWVRLALYSVWLLTFYRWFFQTTHDSWLVMLLIGVHYLVAVRIWTTPASRLRYVDWAGWGGIGGLTMLAQPILGLTWVVLWLLAVVKHGRRRVVVLALLPFVVISGAWVVRNYVVFDRFILIKSNLYYDLHQANVEDADGVISEHSFSSHPANRTEGYAALGEVAFLDGFRTRVVQHVRERPTDYLVRVRNRLLAASLLYTPYFRWFEGHLLLLKQLVYPLPYFALLIVLLLSGFKLKPEVLIALLIYGCYLAPYVLVSFYVRYSIPLALLQLLFCAWALEMAGQRFLGVQRARATSR